MSSQRPEGAGAVMESRARGEVEGDDALTALHRKLEFFPTPPWAARAGGELLQQLDPHFRSIWEPACGEGHAAAALAGYCRKLLCSDIHVHDIKRIAAHWRGGQFSFEPPVEAGAFDFTSDAAHPWDGIDFVVTNPPFATAAEFVRQGLRRAKRGVAILARSSFRESERRHGLFAHPAYACRASFVERVPMVLGRYDPQASTATAYSWFVWLKPECDTPTTRAVAVLKEAFGPAAAIELEIAPGSKARLFRASDRSWAKAQATGAPSLFEGADFSAADVTP